MPPLHSLSFSSFSPFNAACFENTSLTAAASNLLRLLISLPNSPPQRDVSYLRALLIKELNEFEQRAKNGGYSIRLVLAAKYCLCASIDEAMMRSAWGRENSWDEMSLLSYFYKETFGGERFYILLQTMLKDPKGNSPLLELLYILLSLGFKGQYYNKDPLLLKAIKNDVFQKISPYLSKKKEYLLYPFIRLLPEQQLPTPLWVVFPTTALLLLLIAFILGYQISALTKPIFQILEDINRDLEKTNLIGSFYEKIL